MTLLLAIALLIEPLRLQPTFYFRNPYCTIVSFQVTGCVAGGQYGLERKDGPLNSMNRWVLDNWTWATTNTCRLDSITLSRPESAFFRIVRMR